MKERIGSSLAAKLSVPLMGILLCSLIPLFYAATNALNDFGVFAARNHEHQIKSHTFSSLKKIATEQTEKYESYFGKISTASSLLAIQASSIYNNLEIFSTNPLKVDDLKLSQKNSIYYNSELETIFDLYWGGPLITPPIDMEIRALSHLNALLIATKEELPESVATHTITVSGVGKYFSTDVEARKAVFELPPASIFDLRDGEPVTIFTNSDSKIAGTTWTKIYKDDAIEGMMMTASSPVYDKRGQFRGITGVDISLDYITNEVLNSHNDSDDNENSNILFSFLVGQKGELIAFPKKYLQLFGLGIDISKFQHSDDILDTSIKSSSIGSVRVVADKIIQSDHENIFEVILDREKYILSITNIDNPAWHLGIVVREDDLLSSVRDTKLSLEYTKNKFTKFFWWISFISLIFAALIIYFTVSYIIAPLKQLTQSTLKIAGGELINGYKTTRRDEVGVLTTSFSQMVEKLQIAKALETKHLSTLEERVLERTRQLEEKSHRIADSQKRFRILSDAAFEGIVIHHEGKILDVNNTFAKIFGHKESGDIVGRELKEFIAPEALDDVSNKIAADFDQPYESLGVRNNGTIFPVEVCGRSIPFGNKKCRVAALNDITTRKEQEKEREKLIGELHKAEYKAKGDFIKIKAMSQDKLASLGQLATGVAHEINQPLMYIKIILQSFLRDLENNDYDLDEFKEESSESITQLGRISTIIDQLRIFSRADSVELGSVNLGEVLKSTLILMAPQMKLNNIEYTSNLQEGLPQILANANKLEQIFVNLIGNSNDALAGKKDGAIDISIFSGNDNNVIVLFTDNGEGIPKAIVDRIFEPFYSTKEVGKGTGLGLAIIYGIIEEHNGCIEYIETDQGTTFLIRLPVLIVSKMI